MTETINPSRWRIDRADDCGAGRALTGAFLGMITLVLTFAAFLIWDGSRTTVKMYQGRQNRVGTVLAEQAGRDFRAVDLAMTDFIDHIAARGPVTEDTLRRSVSEETTRTAVQQILADLPQI
jgi:hypothetical protein